MGFKIHHHNDWLFHSRCSAFEPIAPLKNKKTATLCGYHTKLVTHGRLERPTPWLKVRCSTNWANGSDKIFIDRILIVNFSDSIMDKFSIKMRLLYHCRFAHAQLPTNFRYEIGIKLWWEKMDSNHRRRRQRIYSPPPLATRAFSHWFFCKKMELMNGLEPLTCWLQISCSANWATSA